MVSDCEGGESSTATESTGPRPDHDWTKSSSDERVFAVVSTPRSSQCELQLDTGGVDETKQRIKVEPSLIQYQTPPRSQQDRSPEVQELKVAQTAVESSKPEPVPVSRTDPARLHKLVSQRIEQSLSSQRQEQSTVITSRAQEVNPSQRLGTVVSVDDSMTGDGGSTPRARLRSEPTDCRSTEEKETAQKTRSDVKQVSV